ncbi:MAG: proton-conducting membrane transporter [Bradyrhizobiaceae bacterium]|nr:MAG: proton-conducting membrane transporter [Bradyrhizobiaceae bacterium]
MVASLFHPLNIFIAGLGGGFAIPLFYRLGKPWLHGAFIAALCGITLIAGVAFAGLLQGGAPIEVLTAGAMPPLSINLRFGLWEGFFVTGVNVIALLGALHLWDRLRGNYVALLLYLILVMGIDGMVMTRDLFNQFVFLEIVSIGTYGLLGLGDTPTATAAAFKYIMATVIASTFFLLGTMLLYYVTGTLNIDALIASHAQITGPVGTAALMFVLASLILEMKPFPANGWGLDTYETAPTGVAAMMSVGVSAGVFFAFLKLLPLFDGQLEIIAWSGGISFLFSNLIGIKQTDARRLLGYSSIGQMGLLLMTVALLRQLGADKSMPLVVGGLFVNHLFAKAGLFWLVGILRRTDIHARASGTRGPLAIGVLGLFLVAIAGLPPFPGFWAKWELVMQLASARKLGWIGLILAGSLLEAAYMFRWFSRELRSGDVGSVPAQGLAARLPVFGAALLCCVGGVVAARMSGAASLWLFAPLIAGAVLFMLDGLPGRVKNLLMLAAVAVIGFWLMQAASGIAWLFAALLLSGSLVIAFGGLYRNDLRPGYYPLLAIMLLSILALLRSSSSLEFFFSWEIITLSSCFLIAEGRRAAPHVLTYLLFSLLSAYFVLAGFATVASISGGIELSALGKAGADASLAFVLLAIGFLIKAGAIGVHIWLPSAYAEADDDFTAMLSAVVSKVAIFGLLIDTYIAIRSEAGLELGHAMAWIGMLTIIGGALMALMQNDFKRLLVFSSMSQIGYIVVATALMSHLGWVTALYLVANHMLVKGILFLALAGIILRTGTRSFSETAGLLRAMPVTFATVLIAVISMSGLPPLMGFGGKWLLLNAMADRGWYVMAAFGLFGTFLGFLYMARLVIVLFFGERKAGQETLREAPIVLLVPQLILIGGILVLSLFPKLLIDPVSEAIDPQFASSTVWQGMPLEKIYSYWNPLPVATVAVMVTLVLFALLWSAFRKADRQNEGFARFIAYYRPVFRHTLPSLAVVFWQNVSYAALTTAGTIRKIYTGNGQTYALYVLFYILLLYVANSFITN